LKSNDFRLGSVLGFEIRIEFSWFVIFFLVFWSLSSGVFPTEFPDLGRGTQVLMGLVGTLLFFASLLIHELSHALVSRAKGIEIEGITLFIFGGMAKTAKEPESPRDEVMIAGIGPITSLALAILFSLLGRLASGMDLGDPVIGVANYLAIINFALAIFNLMPGFPLDGGRVFRATVWAVTGSRTKATRLATASGQTFGLLLIVLGAIQALGGAPLSGLWLVFIGWFLRTLAGASLRQHLMQDVLGGFVAADVMSPHPEVVPTTLSVEALVRDHLMRLRFGSYPVMGEGRPVGLVTLEDVKSVPMDLWPVSTAADAMTPLSECVVVTSRASIREVMEAMNQRGGRRRGLVVDDGNLVGVISATDIARWIERVQGLGELLGEQAGS